MNTKLMAAVAVAVAAASLALSAHAGTPALNYTGDSAQLGNGPFTLGWSFTTTQAFKVDALGAFDADGDGLGESHEVGLWDSVGNLLASTTISAGTSAALVDNFRYNSISALTLAPGDYVIAAVWQSLGDPMVFPTSTGSTTTVAGLTYQENRFAAGGSLTDPLSTAGTLGYFGANLTVGNVPEPMTWALMLVGFGGMGAALRARRRSAITA